MTKYAKALHQLAVEQKKVDKINLHFDEIQSGEQGNFSQGLISINQSQVMAEVDMES